LRTNPRRKDANAADKCDKENEKFLRDVMMGRTKSKTG
jgi:hypothetical protein